MSNLKLDIEHCTGAGHRHRPQWPAGGGGPNTVSGLPVDIKPRELYLLFRPFKDYEGSLIKLTSEARVCQSQHQDGQEQTNSDTKSHQCPPCPRVIARDPYDLMGTALIPASPEAWAPYPLYTTELTPAISHTTFTYPAATAVAAAALHAQVRWYPSSDTTQQGWKYRQFCYLLSLVTLELVLGCVGPKQGSALTAT